MTLFNFLYQSRKKPSINRLCAFVCTLITLISLKAFWGKHFVSSANDYKYVFSAEILGETGKQVFSASDKFTTNNNFSRLWQLYVRIVKHFSKSNTVLWLKFLEKRENKCSPPSTKTPQTATFRGLRTLCTKFIRHREIWASCNFPHPENLT